MILDENHVLGFFNFAFSMQIKNLAQPLSLRKMITFLPKTWLSLKYDHFVMGSRSDMGPTAIERSFRVDLETYVVFKN